ncbi:hypothetical protein ZEAMMB73_Zm00001d003336 [Zea mays]|uniref:Transposase Tnp1/En/Spm-like domain-containing protein n=1 Tax=Zea mays TaxID=4577 RepID=A0A1D6E8Q3_MAIZE|nr:hypothetical protein ZEAMMB73_Zm00001d003336 [Zea mays]
MGDEQGDSGEQGTAGELHGELGAGSAVLGAGLGQRGRRGAMGTEKSELNETREELRDSEMEEESFAVGGHQSGEVSEMEPNSKNPTDMDADFERVYVEPQNQEFRMDNEKTYSQREQEAKEYKDLQPTSRNTYTTHKVLCYLIPHLSRFHGIMQTLIISVELKNIKVVDARQGKLQRTNRLATTHKARQFELERDITFDNTKSANSSKSMTKEATSNSLNEEASKQQVKLKEQSTTTFDKTKCATTSKGTPVDRPIDESILTGAQVFLKSWRCPTKTVALGTVLGRDPNHKVGGVKLGREFWMVRVRLVVLPIEPLIRPYDNMEVIGDVGNNLIAWPSCCIEDNKNLYMIISTSRRFNSVQDDIMM